ncbi:MAG: Uma2 family endonuclease [Candidatus Competibacteraceae bacterium]
MSVQHLKAPTQPILYPDSDGKPMADNTKQFRWISTLVAGLEALFANDPNVFVAGDLLWYPVEGDNKTRIAPDALVVFGRPKGDRGSYRQWEEDDLAPQVVFEVMSPGNTRKEMADKLAFYERYGVEEYYLYDPDNGTLQGWQRQEGQLIAIVSMCGWVSPRLRVRFDLEGMDLCLTTPEGRRFVSPMKSIQQAEQEARRAEQERQRAEQALRWASQEARRAESAEQRAAAAESELARLRELLKRQGIDPAG